MLDALVSRFSMKFNVIGEGRLKVVIKLNDQIIFNKSIKESDSTFTVKKYLLKI